MLTFSLNARIMPLNVAATSVKLAIPPPITRALLRPSGFAVAHCSRKHDCINPYRPPYHRHAHRYRHSSIATVSKIVIHVRGAKYAQKWNVLTKTKELRRNCRSIKKRDSHLSQLLHIAAPHLLWELHCIQHSSQVQKHILNPQPD